MKRLIAIAGMLALASPLFAANPADEVRQAEIAFAKAFADRDAVAFSTFVADDAQFLNRKGAFSGKKAVMDGWSKMLAEPKAPFSWKPERVFVNGSGTIGFSTGPVSDADGKLLGAYSSIWQKEADGTWKVIFDAPLAPPPCPPGDNH